MADIYDWTNYDFEKTREIDNKLINAYNLTLVEDTFSNWICIEERPDSKLLQHNKMNSLFKTEYLDGRYTYSDNDRCCCEDISDHCRYYSEESTRIIDRLFPITMPYIPKDRYIFLVDTIGSESEEVLGTAYLQLFKNHNPIEDFKPIYILNDKEIDKETWMNEKEAHNDNN